MVQIVFLKCSAQRGRVLFQKDFWCLNSKSEIYWMTRTPPPRVKPATDAILKHHLLFRVLNDSCLKFSC